jgi:hypothetical protein
MDLVLDPPHGLGPLRMGTTRETANSALEQLRDTACLSESDRPGQRILRPSGLMISIECVRDTVLVARPG